MTKERHPLTPYRALNKIALELGWDGCAAVIDKKETTLRKYSDPDTGRELSLRDAIRLDAAFRRAGGIGAPLFEAYADALDIGAVDASSSSRDLIAAASTAAKEAGEAVAAALNAASHGDDPVMIAIAHKEAGEAIEALRAIATQTQRGAA